MIPVVAAPLEIIVESRRESSSLLLNSWLLIGLRVREETVGYD